MTENEICTILLDCAFKIHRTFGPGLLESAYKECLYYEAGKRGLTMHKEKPVALIYEQVKMEVGYRADLIANQKVIVEVKAVDAICDIHMAQVITYLKLTNLKLGLLINFNVPLLKNGIRRVVNNL